MPYHYLIHDEVFEKLSIPSEEKLGRQVLGTRKKRDKNKRGRTLTTEKGKLLKLML